MSRRKSGDRCIFNDGRGDRLVVFRSYSKTPGEAWIENPPARGMFLVRLRHLRGIKPTPAAQPNTERG